MRIGVPLREIKGMTTEQLWTEVQRLRNEVQTHNHLDIGNAQMLTGTFNGIFQSTNFIVGSSGCQINWATGSVEFNSGIFRGDLLIGSGNNIIVADPDHATYRFWIGHATDPTSAGFAVEKTGVLHATGAIISGTLTATAGAIGGWTLSANAIYLDTGTDATSSGMASGDYPFYAGKQYASRSTAPFRVTNAGVLYATGVVISGIITGSSLHIPDQDTTANSFHTNTTGDSWWGCTETDFGNDNDNANAFILMTGVAKFQSITVVNATVTTPTITGGTLAIGSSNNIFKADANGIYLGHATFGSAPFRVTMAGALVATSATITGAITISSGSGIANLSDAGALAVLSVVGDAYITDLTVEKLTGTTLTGKTIQTSASGQRVVMNGALNLLAYYDASTLQAYVYGSAGTMLIAGQAAGTDVFISSGASGEVALYKGSNIKLATNAAGIAVSGVLAVTGNITVGGTVDGVDIATHAGNNSAHHSNTSSGIAIVPATISTTGSVNLGATGTYTITPRTNLTYDLGATSYYWNYLRTRYAYITTWISVATGAKIYRSTDIQLEFLEANLVCHRHFVANAVDLNLGSAGDYWNEVNYKSLQDRGCLGVFDNGVELQDGRKVSDVEALKSIQKHPTLQTIYGVPRFDYATMPKAVFSPAPIAKEDVYKTTESMAGEKETKLRYKKGEKMGEDGAETTALISILIGAVKELSAEIDKLKQQ